VLSIRACQLLLQVRRLLRLAQQRVQHNQIRNRVSVAGRDFMRLLQRSFGFREAAEMQFGHGLCDEGVWGLRLGCLCEFFEDIECGLVFLAALQSIVSVCC
jgi:hypothetical protein